VSGATILLLHALPLDARMWDAQRAVLEEAGYAVVAPDFPGREPEIGFSAWAERALGLVEGPFVPVGCSMGGYLAFELWRRAPEQIPALVLVDSRATPDTPEQRQARDDAIGVLGESGREPFWNDLAPRLFAPDASPAVVEWAHQVVLGQPVTGLVAAQETISLRSDSRPTLATIDVPVLVIVGELDVITPPADAETMVAGLADARLVVLPGAGHLTPIERPREVGEAVLDFLREANL
jgi:pimeloyl-ACP methyl ester carboxylesterase